MAMEDKDYLFAKTTRRLPSAQEVAEMVSGIIPWSTPSQDDPEVSFSHAAMDSLVNRQVEKNQHYPVATATGSKKRVPLHPLKLPAGYTYWGQWIAHDIVEPTHPSQNHFSSRRVTPVLNMDSLYGEVNGLPSHMLIDEQGFFRLPAETGECLRDSQGSPLLAEPRNNDNAIILQFHVQWQRIHNLILKRLSTGELPHLCQRNDYFLKARQITVSLFHRLVRQEWLKAILDKSVYQYYFGSEAPAQTLIRAGAALERVPYEFSHAAFRFGHSMVRETYKLRDGDSFDLRALLSHQSFRGKSIGTIDWSLFLGEFAQEVQPINLIVVAGMASVPVSRNIAERNITAGCKAEIMTVQECKHFIEANYPALFNGVGMTMDDSEALLTELKIDTMNQSTRFYHMHSEGRLPLWPFILAESSVQEDNPGHRLGKLGSVIVAEVMVYAMAEAEKALFNSGDELEKARAFHHHLSERAGLSSADALTLYDLFCKQELFS